MIHEILSECSKKQFVDNGIVQFNWLNKNISNFLFNSHYPERYLDNKKRVDVKKVLRLPGRLSLIEGKYEWEHWVLCENHKIPLFTWTCKNFSKMLENQNPV